jgi:asparagine synthase (glutamine-hydrolysing)
MWDHDHRFCIVFNGEIYNYLELREELRALGHRFTTESDTEVILEAFKAWGSDALQRLNGMFSFAISEPTAGRLWLVRDRFGVKPLYYHHAEGVLVFSSTPAELARQLSLKPNLAYVSRGLHYWLYEDDGPISQYEGVDAVPSGHFLAVRDCGDGRLDASKHRYYDLATRVQAQREELAGVNSAEGAEQVLALLQDAVRLRLRADVPVGISLSGGLDSSSIAALASEMHADVRAFSYGRPDVPDSEGPLVAHVASKTGVQPNYIWPSSSLGISAFWDTLEAQDSPFPSLSIVAQFLIFKSAHEQGLKVLLGGQGADEVLMGYRKFQVLLLLDAVRRRDARAALRFGLSAGLMVVAEAQKASVYLRQRQRYLSSRGLRTHLRLPPPAELDLAFHPSEAVWQRQVRDVQRLSLPTLLRYEDRNSMGNSLETRLPFLDYRFVELALALPDRVKVGSGYGKRVLRDALAGRVPRSVRRARYKRGFDAPQFDWISSGLGQSIRHRLSEATTIAPYMNHQSVDELFNNQRLATDPTAIAEATSLLWLSSK